MCDPVKEISTGLTDLSKATGTKALGDAVAEGDLSKFGSKLSNDLSATWGDPKWVEGLSKAAIVAGAGYLAYGALADMASGGATGGLETLGMSDVAGGATSTEGAATGTSAGMNAFESASATGTGTSVSASQVGSTLWKGAKAAGNYMLDHPAVTASAISSGMNAYSKAQQQEFQKQQYQDQQNLINAQRRMGGTYIPLKGLLAQKMKG